MQMQKVTSYSMSNLLADYVIWLERLSSGQSVQEFNYLITVLLLKIQLDYFFFFLKFRMFSSHGVNNNRKYD